MSFPKRGQIFQDRIDRIKSTVARPSLDTFYEVNFSFGKYQTWLGQTPGKRRTQGTDFMQKMKLMCTQAEIPGTSFVESSVTGHHQGITEAFPNLRNFPPLNLVFYADADHDILEVLESWMSYINPIFDSGIRNSNAFTRFNYPEDYKETIHITKFERDVYTEKPKGYYNPGGGLMAYKFVRVFPVSINSMPITYEASQLLKVTVTMSYLRYYITEVEDAQRGGIKDDFELGFGDSPFKQAALNTNSGLNTPSTLTGQGGRPLGDTTIRNNGRRRALGGRVR